MSSHILIKRVLLVALVILLLLGIKGYGIYKKAFMRNFILKENHAPYIYIKTGADYNDVLNALNKAGTIKNLKSFTWTANRKKYKDHIYPGRYKLSKFMNNNELINLLRSGRQTPVNVTFSNIRTLEELASKVSEQIEADSDSIMQLLTNEEFLKQHGFNHYTIPGMFIPNTYEFYWNTTAKEFFLRMEKEYDAFWNADRTAKAEEMHFTKNEVITLASIVKEETLMPDERRKIAGVYINRLHKGIRLQADPTVRFALGDFGIRRVLKKQLQVDSPYNTYKYGGLPPGPIAIPSIGAIDAVLNYEKNDYLYFCAKPDFSGYHNFAKTLAQHNKNARLYQRVLNRRKILN